MSKEKTFEIGKSYGRKEISEILGGNYQPALPHTKGEVVAGCYVKKMNPGAPEEILVGKGRDKEKYSKKLAEQKTAIPIFIKYDSTKYVFEGNYRAVKYSDDIDEINRKNINDTGRNSADIAAVLYYQKVETP